MIVLGHWYSLLVQRVILNQEFSFSYDFLPSIIIPAPFK
ncbi:hypothetical protein GP5015_1428 [gamma proteobacterium HTCC5015]|nr:hypothetical protein GP5015_1428 [gamma proteobacterium HTCC5015]